MLWLSQPNRSRAAYGAVLGAMAIGLMAAGCGKATPKSTASAALETGPGVSGSSITLGVLTDRTGPFAAAGKAVEQGRILYWDAKNAAGGICNRKVEFKTADGQYKPDVAKVEYDKMKENVLGLDELLGTPVIDALNPTVRDDKMVTMAASWASNLLENPYIVISGSTYPLEMINGVDYLVKNKGLKKDDVIGHIYLSGYGDNALLGSKAAAAEYGLKLEEVNVKATDTDLTAQVTALKNKGAKYVLLSGSSTQTGSAVAVAETNNFDMTFLGSNPTFSGALVAPTSDKKAAMEKRYLAAGSTAPWTSDQPGPSKLRKDFAGKFPNDKGNAFVVYGYAQGQIMAQILESACKSNKLTRAGMLAAFQSLKSVSTDGNIAPLDFSKPGKSPSTDTYIYKADGSVEGGLTVVQGLSSAPLAKNFKG